MGIQQSNLQQFHQKYNIDTVFYQKYQISPHQSSTQSTKYLTSVLHISKQTDYPHIKKLIDLKTESQCPYLVKLQDKFVSSTSNMCSDRGRTILVYQQNGTNLLQMMSLRKQTGRYFTEQDANYMLECTLRGYYQLKKIGDTSQILTTSCIVLAPNCKFKLLDSFLIPTGSCSERKDYIKEVVNIYGIKNKQKQQQIRQKQQNWKNWIFRIQQKLVNLYYTSLLALGLIAINMLNLNFDIEALFHRDRTHNRIILREQFDWVQLRSIVKSIKHEALKQKLWLLISEYPTEREEVFSHLNNNFIQVNYPIQLLLKKTTIWEDLPKVNYDSAKFSFKRQPRRPSMLQSAALQLNTSNSHISPFLPFSIQGKDQFMQKNLLISNPSTKNSQYVSHLWPATPIKNTNIPIINTIHPDSITPIINYNSHGAGSINNNSPKIMFSCKNNSIMSRSLPMSISGFQHKKYPSMTFQKAGITHSSTYESKNCNILRSIQINKNSNDQRILGQNAHKRAISIDNMLNSTELTKFSQSNELINQSQTCHIDQNSTQFKKKTLQDLLQGKKQCVQIDFIQQDQRSDQAERVNVNAIFPGYEEHIKAFQLEQPIPVKQQKKIFQQPPLFQVLHDYVINQQSSQNSRSEHSQLELQSEFVIQEYQNGGKYQGYKKNELRQGYGKLYFANGQIYDGEWKKNKMEGYGKLFDNQDCLVYEGKWKKDCFHGRGKLYNMQATEMKSPCDFLNFSANKDNWITYQGQFVDDEKCGHGRLIFQNDEYYQGGFKNNKITGQGYFSSKNGAIIHGLWKEWKLSKIY